MGKWRIQMPAADDVTRVDFLKLGKFFFLFTTHCIIIFLCPKALIRMSLYSSSKRMPLSAASFTTFNDNTVLSSRRQLSYCGHFVQEYLNNWICSTVNCNLLKSIVDRSPSKSYNFVSTKTSGNCVASTQLAYYVDKFERVLKSTVLFLLA